MSFKLLGYGEFIFYIMVQLTLTDTTSETHWLDVETSFRDGRSSLLEIRLPPQTSQSFQCLIVEGGKSDPDYSQISSVAKLGLESRTWEVLFLATRSRGRS